MHSFLIVLVPALAAYLAGYSVGRVKEQKKWIDKLGGEEGAARALLNAGCTHWD